MDNHPADSSRSYEAERKIDRVCRRFERGLREGQEVHIHDFLSAIAGDDQETALRELLAVEFTFRLNDDSGQLDLEVYRQRFPSHHDLIEQVFHEVAAGSPERPDSIGRYRILKELGQGGMGCVFLAHDPKLDRQVALKVPLLEGESIRKRFYREARLMASLSHPNLCSVYDVGEENGIHYLAMAYLNGRSLSDYIHPGHPWTSRGAAALVAQLARGLHAAHVAGIVHRDLKPANIIIDGQRQPIITDFGLARETNDSSFLTEIGSMIGTPKYMAPEQIQSPDLIGPATDIYTLGVILYQLLAGRLPYEGPPLEVVHEIVSSNAPPPSQYNPDVDPEIAAVCLKAMARNPVDRHESAQALADELERVALPSGSSGKRELVLQDDRIGSRLGKYEITGVLGCGGMGIVYRGHDPIIARDVAMKVLPMTVAGNEKALQRFLLEARASGRVNHPNVVAVYDIDRDGDTWYIVMELVPGGTIKQRMQREPLHWHEAAYVMAEAATGLAAAHEAGLIHRDIKPSNLLLAADGSIKLADFGLVKAEQDAIRVSGSGQIIGTAQYMSPEQCQSAPLDTRSDIYSLGATFYTLLTGDLPFGDSDTNMQVMFAHCDADRPDAIAKNPDVPESCQQVVLRSMAVAVDDRYQSARDMLADLNRILAGEPLTPWKSRFKLAAEGEGEVKAAEAMAATAAAEETAEAAEPTVVPTRVAVIPPWIWWLIAGVAVVAIVEGVLLIW